MQRREAWAWAWVLKEGAEALHLIKNQRCTLSKGALCSAELRESHWQVQRRWYHTWRYSCYEMRWWNVLLSSIQAALDVFICFTFNCSLWTEIDQGWSRRIDEMIAEMCLAWFINHAHQSRHQTGDDALMRKTNTEVLSRHIECMNISFPITLNKNTQHEARFDLRHSCMSALLAREHSEMSVRSSKLGLSFSSIFSLPASPLSLALLTGAKGSAVCWFNFLAHQEGWEKTWLVLVLIQCGIVPFTWLILIRWESKVFLIWHPPCFTLWTEASMIDRSRAQAAFWILLHLALIYKALMRFPSCTHGYVCLKTISLNAGYASDLASCWVFLFKVIENEMSMGSIQHRDEARCTFALIPAQMIGIGSLTCPLHASPLSLTSCTPGKGLAVC